MEIGQFSLRTMFVGIALLCLATFGLSGRPNWVAGIALSFITLLTPAALAAGIVHGDKYVKTFCAGAMTGAPVGLVYFTHMVFGFLRDEPSLNILGTFAYVATTKYRWALLGVWLEMCVIGVLSLVCACVVSRRRVRT